MGEPDIHPKGLWEQCGGELPWEGLDPGWRAGVLFPEPAALPAARLLPRQARLWSVAKPGVPSICSGGVSEF